MIVRAKSDVPINQWLRPGKEYRVLGLYADAYRVLNERHEPTIFKSNEFDIIDASIPSDWIWLRMAEDEYYADPPGLHEPGFYEDYFDRKAYALERFNNYLLREKKRDSP